MPFCFHKSGGQYVVQGQISTVGQETGIVLYSGTVPYVTKRPIHMAGFKESNDHMDMLPYIMPPGTQSSHCILGCFQLFYPTFISMLFYQKIVLFLTDLCKPNHDI